MTEKSRQFGNNYSVLERGNVDDFIAAWIVCDINKQLAFSYFFTS